MKALIWLVGLYLMMDFADVNMPGVFVFDADASVEVTHRAPVPDLPAPTGPPRAVSTPDCHLLHQDRAKLRASAVSLHRAPEKRPLSVRLLQEPAEVDPSEAA